MREKSPVIPLGREDVERIDTAMSIIRFGRIPGPFLSKDSGVPKPLQYRFNKSPEGAHDKLRSALLQVSAERRGEVVRIIVQGPHPETVLHLSDSDMDILSSQSLATRFLALLIIANHPQMLRDSELEALQDAVQLRGAEVSVNEGKIAATIFVPCGDRMLEIGFRVPPEYTASGDQQLLAEALDGKGAPSLRLRREINTDTIQLMIGEIIEGRTEARRKH